MKLMVIDGNSIVNRAFYGVRPLTTRDGLYTNAVYGFLSIYLKLLEDEQPDGVCVAFDLRAPTFRHQQYAAYKAQRKGMPDELAMQMEPLKELLDAMRVCRIECEGYEADDIIGTVSRLCAESGDTCAIVTGDRDSFQLVANPGTQVLLVSSRMGKTETVRYDRAAIEEKYGLAPERMRDLKGLMGDASDNIPGVRGIGEKTALDLLHQFETMDKLYAELETATLRPAVREKLKNDREQAFLSRELATICQDAPIAFTVSDAKKKDYDADKLYQVLTRLEFQKFLTKFKLEPPRSEAPAVGEAVSFEPYPGTMTELCAALQKASRVAVAVAPRLDGVGVAFDGQCAAVCRMDTDEAEYAAFLGCVFGERVKKICHDTRALMVTLLEEQIAFGNFSFDTALAAYLIEPSRGKYPIEFVAEPYVSGRALNPALLEREEAFAPLGDCAAAKEVLNDLAQAVWCMEAPLAKEIEALGLSKILYEIEQPLARLLAELQHTGMKVNQNELRALGESLFTRLNEISERIYAHAGFTFNILSTKQLGEVLFEKLGLPPAKKTKSGYSTDIDVLQKLRELHPIVPDLIEYRQCAKLKSTYADGLVKVIAPDGRIHGSFHQMTTATGRISSTEPNLQNIPVRTEQGGEVRRMFVPEPGFVLIDADYSQIELRILAHIADDPAMQRAFTEHMDIHTATAAQVFGVSPDAVDATMRRAAKAVNFGIVYGISEHSLAEDIGVSYYEAKHYMEQYLERYAGVRTYMKDVVERARQDGYVTTLLGRRRNLPELKSKNYNLRSFGERVALNAPIQGTAADIMKLAMLGVRDRLLREGLSARMILQVHDELLVEAPREEAEAAAKIVKEEMERAYVLCVPLEVEVGIGESWYDAKR